MAAKKSAKAKAAKATKAAQKKTVKAKSATTAAPVAVTPKADNSPKKSALPIPVLLAAVLIAGVVIGMFSMNPKTGSTGDVDSQIEAYIRANPGLILEVVTKYNMDRAEQERQQAVNLVKLDDGKTILGNPNGDITVYEFSDYNCGYCKRAFGDVQKLIASDDNVRVVIKEFPILAESSKQAAEISMAAAELGKFEEVHTALMTWQGRLDDSAFDQIIQNAGLSRDEINAIIAKGEIEEKLQAIRQTAQAMQISGTPGFVIGNAIIPGAISSDEMAQIIADERAKAQ